MTKARTAKMELYEAMRTTFAARDFRDEPMPDAVLQRILDNARFAASGGNRQGWLVIDVRDSAKRDALVPLIQPAFRRYLAQMQAGESPWNTITPSRVDAATVAATRIPPGYIERLCHAPRLLMVFVDLAVVASMDQHLERIGVISGASIYPFVWNILLAARNEGYGGTLTTFAAAEEPALRELLGVPAHYAASAMLPLGRPVRQLTRLKRRPVASFTRVDAFDGPAFGEEQSGG